jgi:amidase
MSNFDELLFLDATAQAELIRRKECQPIELVDAAIERIERLNPALNAVVTPMYDMAREAAKDALPDGPFKGVPFLIKDLIIEVKGVRCTEGSAFLKNFVSDYDSTLATRLRQAGLIFLGKTNTPEFGLLATTEPELHGPCRNPWHPDKTPGGSSGGAAAAVASGMVPMAHGNDGAGSIRIPASCCGLFGLKPTRARNPLGPEYNDIILSSVICEHALTRSVRDSAGLLDATSGPESGAPYQVQMPVRPFVDEIGKAPGRLRIAFSEKTLKNESPHPDCVDAVRDAAKLCADLGHEIVEDTPAIDRKLMSKYGYIWALLAVWSVDYWVRRTGRNPSTDQFEKMTWALYEWGMNEKALGYMKAQMKLQELYAIVAEFFENYDIWLTPTLREPPVDLGVIGPTPDNPLNGFYRSGSFAPFTAICNITGLPAMSVPLFWNSDGLPIGTHFVGRYGDEATLFRLAAQLESVRPWAKRRPRISAELA